MKGTNGPPSLVKDSGSGKLEVQTNPLESHFRGGVGFHSSFPVSSFMGMFVRWTPSLFVVNDGVARQFDAEMNMHVAANIVLPGMRTSDRDSWSLWRSSSPSNWKKVGRDLHLAGTGAKDWEVDEAFRCLRVYASVPFFTANFVAVSS